VKLTDRIAGLLSENLGQLDHLSIALELLGKVNHLVGRILLFTGSCSGQKGSECSHGDRVALLSASCGKLFKSRSSQNMTLTFVV